MPLHEDFHFRVTNGQRVEVKRACTAKEYPAFRVRFCHKEVFCFSNLSIQQILIHPPDHPHPPLLTPPLILFSASLPFLLIFLPLLFLFLLPSTLFFSFFTTDSLFHYKIGNPFSGTYIIGRITVHPASGRTVIGGNA